MINLQTATTDSIIITFYVYEIIICGLSGLKNEFNKIKIFGKSHFFIRLLPIKHAIRK